MSAESGFIPGQPWDGEFPLARYLPRVERGVATKWLQRNQIGQGVVIDPFGASPTLALEIARSGACVLVAANNPIAKFLIEAAASAPTKADLRAALSELAAARRGQERLEPHIISLYSTECDNCRGQISAEAFLWRRDEDAPYARIYTCPHCENSGEFPTTEADKQAAAKFTSSGLHQARALERIAPIGSPHRKHAEEALDVYPPRAMYALSILVNKLDGLRLSAEERTWLDALLLTTLDRSNAMWTHPRGRARPKQLSIPSQFREHNIWYSLEHSITTWTADDPGVRLSYWPDISIDEAGICLYDGRMRDLSRELGSLPIAAVLTALPRPNQAFWTLSALWSGWLWGHEALGAFEHVLGRRRYDWAWHTGALTSALQSTRDHLGESVPFLGLVTESEARFEAAAVIAGHQAGLKLTQFDLRPQEGQSQINWLTSTKRSNPSSKGELAVKIQDAAAQVLELIGQPEDFSRLQAAALEKLEREGDLLTMGNSPGDIYTEFRSVMESALPVHNRFKRFGGGEGDLESGLWWLQSLRAESEPLADRVEVAAVNHLVKNPKISLVALDEQVCSQFPGLLTPRRDLVHKIVTSYGWESDAGWILNPSDTPEARRSDLEEIKTLLFEMGKQLGFEAAEGDMVVWNGASGKPEYCFQIQASALVHATVSHQHGIPKAYIVLPGGRAELVMFKLKNDPRLAESIEEGWKFLKFRGVRRLANNPAVQRESIDELFGLDPLAEDDPQIPLL